MSHRAILAANFCSGKQTGIIELLIAFISTPRNY
jgi:hypothetical protein